MPGTVPGSRGTAVDTRVRNPAWCSQSLHAGERRVQVGA